MFAEDLSPFFNTAEFAVQALYTPPAGSQLSANVIFDSPAEMVINGEVISIEYAMTMKAADFPTLKYNEQVSISGVNYKVREVQLIDDGAIKIVSLSKI